MYVIMCVNVVDNLCSRQCRELINLSLVMIASLESILSLSYAL